jgi:hypothetical protein
MFLVQRWQFHPINSGNKSILCVRHKAWQKLARRSKIKHRHKFHVDEVDEDVVADIA